MDTWSRLTAVREEGNGWKKVQGLGKEHICITQGHTQQCDEGQREEGLVRGQMVKAGEKWGHLQ